MSNYSGCSVAAWPGTLPPSQSHKLAVLPGTTHGTFIDHADVLLPMITLFLDRPYRKSRNRCGDAIRGKVISLRSWIDSLKLWKTRVVCEGTNLKNVVSNDGTLIAYDQIGKGPAIILVDGAFGSRVFGPMPHLAPFLAKDFTVFLYDRRGRNKSGDTPPYAVEREIEDIEALISEAGGSAFVYGISSGAALALEAAAVGINIRKLALYEPPFVTANGNHKPQGDAVRQLSTMIAAGRRGDAVDYFMTKLMGMPSEAIVPMKQAPFWPLMEAVAHTLVYDVIIMGDWSVPAKRLASVTVPTLVMNGELTDSKVRYAARAVADALPHAQYRILKSQTHDVAPDALAPVLKTFFMGPMPGEQGGLGI